METEKFQALKDQALKACREFFDAREKDRLAGITDSDQTEELKESYLDAMKDLFNGVADFTYLKDTPASDFELKDYLEFGRTSWADNCYGDEWEKETPEETVWFCIMCGEGAADEPLEADMEKAEKKLQIFEDGQMSKKVDEVIYDTRESRKLGERWSGLPISDNHYESEALYQTKAGDYFLAGKGGCFTKYAEQRDINSFGPGEDIIPLSDEEAKEWIKNASTNEKGKPMKFLRDGDRLVHLSWDHNSTWVRENEVFQN